ncbi:hypothetical protein HV824_16015 [Myxococcus sp. AM009]|uniref:hypothetical protein n=1 Tax=Myxococcus sp. AM009 TaxID=2745137 RepID=UPI0015960A99|nr:hypothetical protein [Myxococcus sp. AM009]NVI99616.1 hypothetical protein [Myxococcus sp. AM009]
MTPVKRAVYASLLLMSGGLSACGPVDSVEQDLTQAEAGLRTCLYAQAESSISQDDACARARTLAPSLCADLGGVSHMARCVHGTTSDPWLGRHYVCCKQ